MTTLIEFVTNDLIPNTNVNLDFNRNELPQLKTNDFLNDLTTNNIPYQIVSVDPKDLIPTQNEYNFDKIKSLVMSLRSGAENKPIIVSSDNYILDGHHRWAACAHIGCPQPIYYINKGINDIMDFVKDKDYTQYKTINESVLSEDSSHTTTGITEVDNMKRQLIDLLRIRVQNVTPTPSPKEFSDILAKYSIAILQSSPDVVKKDYNEQVVKNKITPLEITKDEQDAVDDSNTDNAIKEDFFNSPPDIRKLKTDQDFIKAHEYYRGKEMDANYNTIMTNTPNNVFTRLVVSNNYKDRVNMARYAPDRVKALLLTDTSENVRAELANNKTYHSLLMHDSSKKVKQNLINSTPYSNILMHLSRDKDESISTQAREKIQTLPFVSDNIKQAYR